MKNFLEGLITRDDGKLAPRRFRFLINLWLPYRAANIRLLELDEDWMRVKVGMGLRPYNRNFVGTQFGGSMFSMSDPWWMLMLIQQLGPDYVVWDKSAEVDFVAPGKGPVTTEMKMTEQDLDEIKEATKDGGKCLRWFENRIVDQHGALVATINKQVYIRQKRRDDPGSASR